MNGLSRRALACAVTAASGAAMLVGAAAAQAQKPASVGDGVKTGQLSVQMFNYGGYINNGGGTGAANPVTGVSAACLTSTTPACRAERLERLFAFLESKGVTGIELFGHAGFPADSDIAGLTAYRALLDKYHLHAGGWHGSMNEANWDARVNAAKILGADFIGSGGVADPGINTYAATLASANALNRLGKRSVEAGVGPAYIHNHTDEFDRKYVDDGVLKTAFDILMENTDPRYVAAEVDVFWSSDAFDDVTGTQTAALINRWPTRVQLLHIKDGINITARGTGISSRGGSPRATGTGELDFKPIFAAAANRVRYYHQEQDGGTLTDADISFTNLKGVNTASVPTVLGLPTTFPTVAAGTAATQPIVLQNTGDKPLDHHRALDRRRGQRRAGDGGLLDRQPELHGGPAAAGRAGDADHRRGATWHVHRRGRLPAAALRRDVGGAPAGHVGLRQRHRARAARGQEPGGTGLGRHPARRRRARDPGALRARPVVVRDVRPGRRAQLRRERRRERHEHGGRCDADPAGQVGHGRRLPRQRNPRDGDPAAVAGAERGDPRPGVRVAGRGRRDGQDVLRTGHQRRGPGGLPPGHRCQRRPARRHLQQDADVHAVDRDAVI